MILLEEWFVGPSRDFEVRGKRGERCLFAALRDNRFTVNFGCPKRGDFVTKKIAQLLPTRVHLLLRG
jgi:hypothetical protein